MPARDQDAWSERTRGYLRRRVGWLLLGVAIIGALAFALSLLWREGYKELALPLRHDDIIRQQARDKDLDPALIAAVIYHESRFRPRESHAGAQGLMQILPSTAEFIAQKSGGTQFDQSDLATPQVNIAYGSWYLRYLLNRYDGDALTALAAYNAGEGRVDRWLADGGKSGGSIEDPDEIPFTETREYVRNVLSAQSDYAREYANELSR